MAADFLGTAVGMVSGLFNSVVAAAIILLIGLIAGRVLGKLVERVVRDTDMQSAVRHVLKINIPLGEVIGSLVTYFAYFLSVMLALDVLNIENAMFSIVAGLVIMVIFLSIVLSLKDFLTNVFGGIYVHQKGVVRPGDIVRVSGIEGTVVGIELIDTRIETVHGDLMFVPNSLLIKNAIRVKRRRS
ncbi:mechanosensitive ion channel family protein [Candidatus Woesearchaeota archaeon]|nr:mechanosensitive ion channel family protein [Candidatus Woesearchaeota archaeon]